MWLRVHNNDSFLRFDYSWLTNRRYNMNHGDCDAAVADLKYQVRLEPFLYRQQIMSTNPVSVKNLS
jgi:hypothetical protein